MKLVFFGTPDFAVPSLCALHESHHEVIGVVTNPDKKSGRGQKVQSSPVKITAEKYGYTIFQPKDLRNNDFISQIKQIKSDIYVVVAFKILPKSILKIPQKGAVNLHASLLPMFRGAAPINHAILNGETKTGVTTFQIQKSVDTGDILLQHIISLNNSSIFKKFHKRGFIRSRIAYWFIFISCFRPLIKLLKKEKDDFFKSYFANSSPYNKNLKKTKNT